MASSDSPTLPPHEPDWGALLEELSTIGQVRAHFEERGTATDRWSLEGSPADVEDMTGVLEDLAVGLGYPDGPDTWVAVLETLRRESTSFRYGGTITTFDNAGESGEGRYGTIDNLRVAATSFCRKLRRERQKIARLKEVQERTPAPSAPDLNTKQGRIATVNARRATWALGWGRLPPGNWMWKAAGYSNRRPYHDWINTGKYSARFRIVLGLPTKDVIKRVKAWRPKSKL